jgi:catecholate siderophore receptor
MSNRTVTAPSVRVIFFHGAVLCSLAAAAAPEPPPAGTDLQIAQVAVPDDRNSSEDQNSTASDSRAARGVTEEIIVPGRQFGPEQVSGLKTGTPPINVPQSLSIVSREQIQEQAFQDIGDVLRFTPGAAVGQGEGHRDQVTIRGQNTTADFFINGLRDDVQYFRPFYNLERIEILRGANALVFGRGGGGGVINRVTKSPDLERSFIAGNAGADTFGAYLGAIDTNVTVGERSAFRLNAYYESLQNHRDFFDGERYAVNPTFATAFGPNTTLELSYEYVKDDRVVDRGVPSVNGSPLRGFDNTFFGDPQANRTGLDAHIVRGRVDHRFTRALSFNTTVQYADYDKFYQNLFPVGADDVAATVTLDGYADATERQNLIVQSNLVAEFTTGLLAHTVLFGAEYGDQRTANARNDVLFDSTGSDRVTFPFTDPLVIPAFSFPDFSRDRSSDVRFTSLFVQDELDIGEHFILVGGLRYDRFDIDVFDRIAADVPDDGNNGLLGRVDEEISPRLGLIYKPRDNVSLYTSYSRSFLPRSGDQFLSLTPSSEALEPESFENYEVGVKWDPRPELSVTAAVFRLDRESGTTVDPNDPGNTLLIGTRTQGVEVQLVGQVLPRWSVNAGYSFLDGDERGRVVDGAVANRTLAQVPEHMFSIWNRVEASDKLSFGLGASYQADQFASISNAVTLPEYVRIDAAVNYRLRDNLQLQLNVENLFDTDYFPAAHNDNNITTGEPLHARFSVISRL